jgi:uncharacterized protein involved in outer membrane biogenesis
LRESLTAFAILLILILTAALVGPMFVDWTSRRSDVEQRLAQVLGTPVKITGPIRVRLLPSPFLELSEVTAGTGDTPEIVAQAARIELAPMPLLQGQIRVVDATLTQPKLRLGVDQNGRLVLPALPKTTPELIRFEHIKITNGRLSVRDLQAGGDTVFDGINADADARSLQGPFNAAGTVKTISGSALTEPLNFHLSTGSKEGEHLKIKLLTDSGASSLHTDLEGAVQFSGNGAAIGFEGAGVFSSHVAIDSNTDLPWKVAGALKIDAHAATYETIELRVGLDERALVATGQADLSFGPLAQARVKLTARQFELDHLLAGNGETAVAPRALVDRLRPVLANRALTAGFFVPIKIDAAIEMVTLGGESLNDVSSNLLIAPGKPIVGHLEVTLPGHTRVSANGAFETGSAAHFSGKIDALSQDVQRVQEWLKNGGVATSAKVPALLRPLVLFRSAAVSGDFEISGVAISGRNLNLMLNRSKLIGAMAFTRAIGTERARLYADLTSEALDLDALPDLSDIIAAGSTIDASVAFDARAVKINRVGQGTFDAGHIGVKLIKNGDVARLERFDIARLGGADLSLTGSRDARGGKLDLRLNAQRLTDLADLLARIAPGRASAQLAARAAALSPAQINVHAEAAAGASGALQLTALSVNGMTGATKINGDGKPEALDPQAFDASLILDSPESSQFLQQLGFEVLPLKRQGKGHVEIALGGRFGAPVDVLADATIAGVNFNAQGQLDLAGVIDAGAAAPALPLAGSGLAGTAAAAPLQGAGAPATGSGAALGPSPTIPAADPVNHRFFDGAVALKTKDASPLGQMLGLTVPDWTLVLPLEMAGKAHWTSTGISLVDLKGAVDNAQMQGFLNWRPNGRDAYGLSGTVSFDRLAVSSLVALALGPQTLPNAQANQNAAADQNTNIWSTQEFGAGLLNPPPTDVALSAGILDLGRGWTAHDLRLKLGLAADRVSLDEVQMVLNTGRAGGHLTLRRDGKSAAMSGHVNITQVAVETPAIRATTSATLDVAATGNSMSELIAGLAGRGTLVVSDVSLPHLDPAALRKVLVASETDEGLNDEGILTRALAQALDTGQLTYDERRLGVALATGVLRFDPLATDDGPLHAQTKTSIDLRNGSLDQRTSLTLDQPLRDWSGPAPSINIVSKGPLMAPFRTIDVASLINGLAARAIARESERINILDADIRERAFFNRRLKAADYQRQREQDLNRFAEEEKRRQAEEDRRRAQDAAIRAANQPPRPLAAPFIPAPPPVPVPSLAPPQIMPAPAPLVPAPISPKFVPEDPSALRQ